MIEFFPIGGQGFGCDRHDLFLGAVKRDAAGLAIEHHPTASIHCVALRMVLFCANGITVQLLFALYVIGAKQSVFIQSGREKHLAHHFYNLAEQRFALGSACGKILLAQNVGAKADHLRVSAVEVAHRKIGAIKIIEAAVDSGNIGVALGPAQKHG